MAQPPTTPSRNTPAGKGLPTLVEELWQLVVSYFKQETVEPLKGLGRFALFGVAGSLFVGIGTVLLLLAGLRALQEETGDTFAGDWSWAPYGITMAGTLLVVVLAVAAVGRRKGSKR